VPAKHGLRRHKERTPGLSRQVTAGRGEEEAVASAEPRPADLPPEHVQLVAQDHDLQVLGIPAPPQKQREESPQDQGRERPDHGGPSLLRCCLDPTSRQLESRSRISVPFRHQPRSLWGFWNFLGAGVFGFLMLSIGIALFCLRYIIPQKLWPDKAVRISFWSLNLGLEWMVFATLFPLGILPLYHSISVSYYDARTLNYIGSRANSILEWMRMPGDIVFIVGGALPIL